MWFKPSFCRLGLREAVQGLAVRKRQSWDLKLVFVLLAPVTAAPVNKIKVNNLLKLTMGKIQFLTHLILAAL